MNKVEKLMSTYPELNYKFESLMPEKQKGLIINQIVYLNPSQSAEELTSTVAEEIGHYLTSIGDIVKQDTNEKRKQEQKARDVGATMVVSPQDVVDCFNERFERIWECTEFLGITEDAFTNAIKTYAKKYSDGLRYKKYFIDFRENGTVGVYEWFD